MPLKAAARWLLNPNDKSMTGYYTAILCTVAQELLLHRRASGELLHFLPQLAGAEQ
ncbi:MAG: hypothetical protein WBW98_15325 [Candidatus Sulfotelmatobacter sp.]|jgi:hypothetical protein